MRAVALLLALVLGGCGSAVNAPVPDAGHPPAPPQQPSATPSTATVSSGRDVQVVLVLDGDTFDAVDGTTRLRVRILGIDAPEISHDGSQPACGADDATAALKRLIDGQHVSLHADPRSAAQDQYGRQLAYVAVSGVDVGLRLIQEGVAEAWYPSSVKAPSRDASYRATTALARTSQTGAWRVCAKLGR